MFFRIGQGDLVMVCQSHLGRVARRVVYSPSGAAGRGEELGRTGLVLKV